MCSQVSSKAVTIVTDTEGWPTPKEGDTENEMLNNVFTAHWKKHRSAKSAATE